jgi:hypothetical protein
MEQCSETSAYKIQTPGNHSKIRIKQCDCWSVPFIGRGQGEKFKKEIRLFTIWGHNMEAQQYGACSSIIEGMLEDIKSQVPIDELSTQGKGIMTKK